jgi:hypothetical protein
MDDGKVGRVGSMTCMTQGLNPPNSLHRARLASHLKRIQAVIESALQFSCHNPTVPEHNTELDDIVMWSHMSVFQKWACGV